MKKIVVFICLIMLAIVSSGVSPEKSDKSKSDAEDHNSPVNSNEFFYPVKGYYVNISPNYSNILSNTYNLNFNFLNVGDENLSSSSGFGFSINAGYFKSFRPNMKFLVGIGITNYNETINDESLSGIRDGDSDVLDFTFVPSANWNKNYTYVSVPVIFEFGNANIDKLSFYFDIGVGVSYLVNKSSIESDNTFNTSTYYGSDLGYVEFEGVNIEALDVYQNKEVSTNPINFSLIGGAGITYPVFNSAILKAGIVTNIGVNEVYSELITSKLDNIGFEVGFYFYSIFDSNQ